MDEIEYLGATSTILSYNLFTYCEGNPVNREDRFGPWPQWLEKAAKTLGEIVEGVVTTTFAIATVVVATAVVVTAVATTAVVSVGAAILSLPIFVVDSVLNIGKEVSMVTQSEGCIDTAVGNIMNYPKNSIIPPIDIMFRGKTGTAMKNSYTYDMF